MLDPQKTYERAALLRRLGEIQVELARIERNIREIESRLPIEGAVTFEAAAANLKARYEVRR